MTPAPFIANTDKAWYDFLAECALDGHLDEANFWSPKSTRPMVAMSPGHPVFLRLKAPVNAIAGHGFFAHFDALALDLAWHLFGFRNGDPDMLRFLQRIGGYRGVDLLDPRTPREPLGCTILTDVHFWGPARWIPWGEGEGFQRNIVRGKTEDSPERIARLLRVMGPDPSTAEEYGPDFVPVDVDEREIVMAQAHERVGQGSFRARLLSAYERRCAITGERTEPVLDAAHIQPYLGRKSNHVRNGLLLTQEFHTLFDAGYVGVTPDHHVVVSSRLKERWSNGKRYYAYHGQPLVQVPKREGLRPSPKALEWHLDHVFLGESA